MSIPLFPPSGAAPASTTGPWIGVWPTAGKFVEMRVSAVGGFSGDTVTVQHSIVGQEAFPITLGTLSNGQDLIIDEPVEQIRAVTGPALVGNARVFAITSL